MRRKTGDADVNTGKVQYTEFVAMQVRDFCGLSAVTEFNTDITSRKQVSFANIMVQITTVRTVLSTGGTGRVVC